MLDPREQKMLDGLERLDRKTVLDLLTETFTAGGSYQLGELIQRVLEEVGRSWEEGRLSLAQVYMDGVICEEAVRKILPADLMENPSLPRVGTAVFLDYHGLGMKIVSSLVRSAGYPLRDAGPGVGIEEILSFVEEENIQVLLLSVLMLPSALAVKALVEQMAQRCPGVKIVVGGAPFRLKDDLWREVGAHRMGRNGADIFAILQDLREELP